MSRHVLQSDSIEKSNISYSEYVELKILRPSQKFSFNKIQKFHDLWKYTKENLIHNVESTYLFIILTKTIALCKQNIFFSSAEN
jgi:hypothetical protein